MYYIIVIGYYICAIICLLIALAFSPLIVFLVGLDVLFNTKLVPWLTVDNNRRFRDEIKKRTKNISEALNDLEAEDTQHITLYITEQLKIIDNLASGIFIEDETEAK